MNISDGSPPGGARSVFVEDARNSSIIITLNEAVVISWSRSPLNFSTFLH